MGWGMEVEMFGDGRLRVPSTSSLMDVPGGSFVGLRFFDFALFPKPMGNAPRATAGEFDTCDNRILHPMTIRNTLKINRVQWRVACLLQLLVQASRRSSAFCLSAVRSFSISASVRCSLTR
jgi:hypothetical protein